MYIYVYIWSIRSRKLRSTKLKIRKSGEKSVFLVFAWILCMIEAVDDDKLQGKINNEGKQKFLVSVMKSSESDFRKESEHF